MANDWSQLPQELLKSIADNIKIYADYIRFRAVCHSVRYSVPNTPHDLPPQLPWLMLPNAESNRPDPAFFDLCTRKLLHLEVAEAVSHWTSFCVSGDDDSGIFKLLDGSIEHLPSCQRNRCSPNYWPPIWVSPNPC